MSTSPILRPIGFRPWEISVLVNQEVIDQHAEEAAFLWKQRDHATSAPQYALKDLARLDERVEAHLDGLLVNGLPGWQTALDQLAEGPGEIFAASVLAFAGPDRSRQEAVLAAALPKPRLIRGLIAALGWLPESTATQEALHLASFSQPEIRRAGIAALAIHRIDPGPLLAPALTDENARLASRALRAAAELGRIDLLPHISSRLNDASESVRFWAAWSAVRLGEHHYSAALGPLRAAIEGGSPYSDRAAHILFRVLPISEAHALRLQLASGGNTLRAAILAAGAIGDPSAIPWLIEQMDNPTAARIAGNAFSLLTGADLHYLDLDRDPPALDDLDDEALFAPDPDSELPWPDSTAVARWWFKQTSYVPGVRYLLGEPISDRSLREALAFGKQDQRVAAALELALRHPGQPLFETRERAPRQLVKVVQWTS